jgi:hypothetical protein
MKLNPSPFKNSQMNTFEIKGKSGTNPATIFVMQNTDHSKWYSVQGSKEVRKTFDEIKKGMRAETLRYFDSYFWCEPIHTMADFVESIHAGD